MVKGYLWQKLLTVIAFVSLGVLIGMPASLLILTILYKIVPNAFIYSLATSFPFIWGPIVGGILGIIVALVVIYKVSRQSK